MISQYFPEQYNHSTIESTKNDMTEATNTDEFTLVSKSDLACLKTKWIT